MGAADSGDVTPVTPLSQSSSAAKLISLGGLLIEDGTFEGNNRADDDDDHEEDSGRLLVISLFHTNKNTLSKSHGTLPQASTGRIRSITAGQRPVGRPHPQW